MKSFWEKATEIGTKAKSIATGYLGTEKQPKKDLDEQEKNFGEKFLNLKNEIDEFKRDTIKAAEEKLRVLADKVKVSEQEKENVQKNFDEQVLYLEASFCEKEKSYLVQINDFEKKIKFKDLHIEKLENSVKELKEDVKGYHERESELKAKLAEQQASIKASEKTQVEGLEALNTLLEKLNKTKDLIISESQALYEIDLEKIKTKVDNFFAEVKLDFSVLNINTENLALFCASNVDENLKNELITLSENVNENLEKITKLVKTVKNELFLVLKNKVESLNKDAFSKFDAYKSEISSSFEANLDLLNDKINELKTLSKESNESKSKTEKEFERVNKEVENYIKNLSKAEKAKAELESKNNELENFQADLQEQNNNYANKVNELENSLKQKENEINKFNEKLNQNENCFQELNVKLNYLSELDAENKKLIEQRNLEAEENKKIIVDFNSLVADLQNEKNNLNAKINELEISIHNLQNNLDTLNELNQNKNNEINFKLDELSKEKKEVEHKLTLADTSNSELTEKSQKLEKELQKLNCKLTEFRSVKKALEDKNAELEKDLFSQGSKQKEEIKLINNKINQETDKKIKELETKLSQLVKEKDDQINKIKDEIELVKQENRKVVSGLEAEKERLNASLRDLETNNADLNKKIEEELEKIKAYGNNTNSNNINNNNNSTPVVSNTNYTNKGKNKKKNNNNSNNSNNNNKLNNNNINNNNSDTNYEKCDDKNIQEIINKSSELEKNIAETTEKLEEAQAKNELLLKEISKLEESFKNANAKANKFENLENNLRNEISERENNAKQNEEKIAELNNLSANLQSEINNLKTEITEKDQKNSAQNKQEKEKHEKAIKLLTEKIAELEKAESLKQKEEEIQLFKTNEEKLNKEIYELQAQLENFKNLKAEADKQIEKLIWEANELKSNIVKLNEENAQSKDSSSGNFDKINFENNELKIKIEKLSQENINFLSKFKESEKELNILKHNTELKTNNLISELNAQLENLSSEFNENKKTLDSQIKHNSDLGTSLSTLIVEKSEALKISESLKKIIKTYKLTFKQFFLMLLDDDIFIDLIQKTFAEESKEAEAVESMEKSSQFFFEKIYSLSKYIKPKIIFSFIKSNCKNLENQLIHSELSKIFSKKYEAMKIPLNKNLNNNLYNSNSNFNFEKLKKLASENNLLFTTLIKLQEISNASLNLEYLEKLDAELSEIEALDPTSLTLSLSQFTLELQYNLDFLSDQLNFNLKKQTELNSQLKSAKETLEDSKKHEGEKYEILNKNIQKLQQECRDLSKTEKLLKDALESTESNLKDAKAENEKLTNKLKALNNLYEELCNEKKSLIDKNIQAMQQMENFRIENLEITEKNAQREILIKSINDKVDHMHKEKTELLSQLADFKKLSDLLAEKNLILQSKEHEIEKMRLSYSELEEFIESLKTEKEQSLEIFKKQIFELNNEVENNKEILREKDEKISSESVFKFEELEKQIIDLQLENKFLKEQKDKMKKYSEEILLKVKIDLKDTEFLIDKRMISNILVKYFDKNTPEGIKKALLDTLANFMGFSNDERVQIGLYVNNVNAVGSGSGNASGKNDKLKDLSDDLYNFILNA